LRKSSRNEFAGRRGAATGHSTTQGKLQKADADKKESKTGKGVEKEEFLAKRGG